MKEVGITEFFKGQNIFVTGATGFIGKVLLEKVLRSCPDVGNIYVVLRPKKGKAAYDRVEDIIKAPLFDIVRRDRPQNLKKIVPLCGDCSSLGLGLSASDHHLLEDTVSIIFHVAATVRFDDPLKSAVLMNTRATREVMLIARNMKNLKVLVHVSTTFCNCDRMEVDEIMYPPHADWRDIINIAENVDENILDLLTTKILCNHPNTYTFTKSLAEHVVKDLGENLPVVIFRPSIVTSTLDEPFPGWVDSFNGPVGIMVAGGKGILRVIYADQNAVSDYVPVDVCTKFMLIAAWKKAVFGVTTEPTVYNSSADNLVTFSVGQMIKMAYECAEEIPLNGIVWAPNGTVTKCKEWYYLNMIFLHLIPGLLIDGFLKFSGRKPRLLKIHKRIYLATMALAFFITRTWKFRNDKLLELRTHVLPCDKMNFNLDSVEQFEFKKIFRDGILAARTYLLNEHPDTISDAKRHYKRMYWLDKAVRVIVILFFLWFEYHNAFLRSTVLSIIKSVYR